MSYVCFQERSDEEKEKEAELAQTKKVSYSEEYYDYWPLMMISFQHHLSLEISMKLHCTLKWHCIILHRYLDVIGVLYYLLSY